MAIQMQDVDRYVIHAGSDKIHKIKVTWGRGPGTIYYHSSQTQCGALTTYMSPISDERARALPTRLHCRRCFG